MPPDEVLNEQPVLQQPDDEDVLLHDSRAVEAAFPAHGFAQNPQSLDEVVGAEILQTGLGACSRHELRGVEGQLRSCLFHEIEDGADLFAVAGSRQVVDADGGRAPTHTVSTGRTSTWGCSGVSEGRNQRNQIRPDACPAVETQLGWVGRRADTTMIHEPSGS